MLQEGGPKHTAANGHATDEVAEASAEGSDMQPPASKRARTDPEPSGTPADPGDICVCTQYYVRLILQQNTMRCPPAVHLAISRR